jgi:hypothetical protein
MSLNLNHETQSTDVSNIDNSVNQSTPSRPDAQYKSASDKKAADYTTLDFFNTVLPSKGQRCAGELVNKIFSHHFVDDNDQLAEEVKRIDAAGHDAYFALSGFGPDDSRAQANVVAVRVFWLDLDCGPGKGYATKQDALKALARFKEELKLRTPWVVDSGNGIHSYFLMSADMKPAEWKAIALLLKLACQKYGLNVDHCRTCDEASVLRPIGTNNRKNGGARPVKLIHPGKPMSLEAFRKRLVNYLGGEDAAAELSKSFTGDEVAGELSEAFANEDAAQNADLKGGIEPPPPSDAHKIAEQCAIIGEVRDKLGKVLEPHWRDVLGVLTYTVQGDEIGHEWSKGDPRYDYDETQGKIDRFRANATGPTTCEKLSDHRPNACAACPHKGKIRSPISLGIDRSQRAAAARTAMARCAQRCAPSSIIPATVWRKGRLSQRRC